MASTEQLILKSFDNLKTPMQKTSQIKDYVKKKGRFDTQRFYETLWKLEAEDKLCRNKIFIGREGWVCVNWFLKS